MTKRKIITIDEKICTGCGQCIPNCPEGAIQIIDGKARLISDLFCDGLGACLGNCPEGALSIKEREAVPYDETKVMNIIVQQGANTIRAHLKHLQDHGETTYLNQAVAYLKTHRIPVDFQPTNQTDPKSATSCPGAKALAFTTEQKEGPTPDERCSSQLTQWPVQMHLISPDASFFHKSDVLLVADCVAYALGDFHNRFLKGKRLAIACPKLDANREVYIEKLVALIDRAHINTITVITMQVPCCNGLVVLAKNAVAQASRKIPIKHMMVSIKGDVIRDEWI